MADAKYARDTQRFDCLGLDLNRPVDSVKSGKFPYLKNVRSSQAGRIEPREGLTNLGTVVAGQTPLHSCRRLNDPLNSSWTRVLGAGTHLAFGQAAPYTDIDSGYSGSPLALVPYRPDQAPDSWMYIGDSSRMRKINRAGSLHPIGLAAPLTPPTAALPAPSYKVVDEFDATAGWSAGGTAGGPALVSYRTNTTISQIVYDTGTTGWATVAPAAMTGIGGGERLAFLPGSAADEIGTVQTVAPGAAASTIAAVIYDSGASGLCSLVLATPVAQASVDGFLRNTTLGENVRVRAVVTGPDGVTSLRVFTAGTFAATNAVQLLPSFRIYLVSAHAAGETVRAEAVRSTVTVGTGSLTKTGALDLSLFATGVPALPADFMHVSLRVDRPDLISEIKVLLDVDTTTNDFTRNFYSRTFRASDLTPSVRNQQPLIGNLPTIVQRSVLEGEPYPQGGPPSAFNTGAEVGLGNIFPSGSGSAASGASSAAGLGAPLASNRYGGSSGRLLIDSVTTPADDPSVVSQQMSTGDVQWVEMQFRIGTGTGASDLIRVGTDDSRTLQNVAAIQVLVICTGTVNVDVDSWWVGGGYGPDSLPVEAIPYFYRYRARIPATGAASNWSPATRGGIDAFRQRITVSPVQYAVPSGTTLALTDIVLDIQRLGGAIVTWHYVGTAPNGATPSFTDKYPDDVVASLDGAGMNHWQPWPVIGVPVSGTTGTVAGTSLNDAATGFSLSWAPGTEIKVNGVPYTIYRVISTSRLETVENMGAQSAVSWQVDEPALLAQNLPCLWGDEGLGALFACGDTINPGRLYFSNGNDPDSTLESYYLDITSPSEPLMNGVVFNLRTYVFSSSRLFQILPTGNIAAPWRAEEIPGGKGLFSRWALTRNPAPAIVFLSPDGLYATVGGAAVGLTDADLYPLFPNEGNPGVSTNGVGAPLITAAQAAGLRVEFYDEFLYFDYPMAEGRASLVLDVDLGAAVRGDAPGGWFWDVYSPNAQFHYGEEGAGVHALLVGSNTGILYQYAGNSDDGVPYSMEITTPSRDQGDPREYKLYGDIMLDADTAGLTVTATPYFDNNATGAAPAAVSTASRLQTPVPFGSAWFTAQNISLNLVCLISTAARPLFYIWEPRWTFESAPISAYSWEISPSTIGMDNFKHMGLVRITHVSTADLQLTFTIDGVAQPVITIPASGNLYTQTVFRVPVMKAKLWKLRLASAVPFRVDGRDSFFQMKDWGSADAYKTLRLLGDYSLVEG